METEISKEIRCKIGSINDDLSDVVLDLESLYHLSVFYSDHAVMETEKERIGAFERLGHLCRKALDKLKEERLNISEAIDM